MKNRIVFNMGASLAVVALLLGGCGKSAPLQPVKKYTLVGHSVQFSPPPDTFEFKEEREAARPRAVEITVGKESVKLVAPSPAEMAAEQRDKNKLVALVFQTPSKAGHIAVHALEGFNHEKLDKDNLQVFADAVWKRGGRFTHQSEVDMLGGKGNGYRMEFEYGSGDNRMRGVELHVPYQKNLYSIIMTVPAKEFPEDLPYYDGIVKTFQVQ